MTPVFHHLISRTVNGETVFGLPGEECLRKLIWQVSEFSGTRIVTCAVMNKHFHVWPRCRRSGCCPMRRLSDASRCSIRKPLPRGLFQPRPCGRAGRPVAWIAIFLIRFQLAPGGRKCGDRFAEFHFRSAPVTAIPQKKPDPPFPIGGRRLGGAGRRFVSGDVNNCLAAVFRDSKGVKQEITKSIKELTRLVTPVFYHLIRLVNGET